MYSQCPTFPSRSDIDWCWYLRRQGRAGEALERILHDVGVMDPGGWANWQPSTLTDTGAPVAMTFAQGQTALELTTEFRNPSEDRTQRVAQVCDFMAGLGANVPSMALRDVISAAQCDHDLDFGARLGLRHDGVKCDAMLYVDLPAAATDLSGLMSLAPFTPVLEELGSRATATMLKFDGTTNQVTIYWAAEGVDSTILPKLAASADVTPDPLCRAIHAMTDARPEMALPGGKLGFSYKAPGEHAPQELSLYFSAKQMLGSDAAAMERAWTVGGKTIDAYVDLMDMQQEAPSGRMNHGLIGMNAQRDALPVLSVSVAAPWYGS